MFLMSSMLFLNVRYLLLEILMTKPTISDACDSGWFGPLCKLQCHCKLSACNGKTGSCPLGEPCAPSYFGPGCQYVNWAFTDSDKRTPAFLRDEDVNTCNDNPSATSVTLTFGTPHRVIWFRMLLNEESMFNAFLVRKANSDNLCQNMETFHVDKHTVDVVCGREVLADTITIEGEMAAHVCSIIVSGGRNVALKQDTAQVSANLKPPFGTSDRAVDGSTIPRLELCIRTAPSIYGSWWRVRFQTPYVLHRVVIYSNEIKHDMSYFRLVTYDESYNTLNAYENPGRIQPVYYVNLSSGLAVTEVRMSKQRESPNWVDRYFNFCEVQAYSHALCPPGTFGFSCNQSCSSCPRSKCSPFTGQCAPKCLGLQTGYNCEVCPDGTFGRLCEHICSSQCTGGLCDRLSGNCLLCEGPFMGQRCEECKDGYFGEICTEPCSELCAQRRCEKSVGVCLSCYEPRWGPYCEVCPDGKYGTDCSNDCSSTCAWGMCDHMSGQCFNCPGNFTGLACKECLRNVYGANCELPCPEYCLNRECDNVTGECLICAGEPFGRDCNECPEGTFGTDCKQTCPEQCAFHICNKTSGDCLECSDGHVGPRCQGFLFDMFLLHVLLFHV
ncbi:hypothetical protein BsWGS_25122 [Bradybaena similaris]